MNIEFNCPECGKLLAIDSKYAGAKVECPKCNAEVQVPEAKPVNKPVGTEKGTDVSKEEKPRLEAQQELKKELENKKQEKKADNHARSGGSRRTLKDYCIPIIAAAFVGLLVRSCLLICSNVFDSANLEASVSFTGIELVITNNDYYDWTQVQLTIEAGSGRDKEYRCGFRKMRARETYKVRVTDFTKKDGTRFNPYAYKPLNISISAHVPKKVTKTERGFYFRSL
jgi:DNA-directed RNA polymerase subunit M/transcription elongation factor TFIIS